MNSHSESECLHTASPRCLGLLDDECRLIDLIFLEPPGTAKDQLFRDALTFLRTYTDLERQTAAEEGDHYPEKTTNACAP